MNLDKINKYIEDNFMKIKVMGIENNVKVSFEGKDYFGRRLHYAFPLSSGEGIGCGSQFLNDTKFQNVALSVGKEYWCDRSYGKLANFTSLEDLK